MLRDRRQQAAVGGVGAGQSTAGRLSGASATGPYGPAATAEQPRSSGSPVEGASATPCCCRRTRLRQRTRSRAGCHRLCFRYVTELPAKLGDQRAVTSMGFEGIGRSTPMLARQTPGGESRPLPIGSRLIGVSLQPAIPRRGALQQSPPPLHRSPTTVTHLARASNARTRPEYKDNLSAPAILAATGGVISTLHAR